MVYSILITCLLKCYREYPAVSSSCIQVYPSKYTQYPEAKSTVTFTKELPSIRLLGWSPSSHDDGIEIARPKDRSIIRP